MSPTIYSADDQKKQEREQELLQQLEEIRSQKEQPEASSQKQESTNKKKKAAKQEPEVSTLRVENLTVNKAEIEEEKVDQKKQKKPQKVGLGRQPEDYSEVMRHENPTTNPFASFVVRPPGAEFINQHNKEKILLVLRQHPVVNLTWIIITILMIVFPFVVLPFLPFLQWLPNRFHFFLMVGWFLLVSAYILENFLSWYFNIFIITDERIVDIDFISMIYRRVSEAKIDKIEDVTATTTGVFAAIFNYGTVFIQTAAEQREFEFKNVPQPAKVTKFINELLLEEEQEKLDGRAM